MDTAGSIPARFAVVDHSHPRRHRQSGGRMPTVSAARPPHPFRGHRPLHRQLRALPDDLHGLPVPQQDQEVILSETVRCTAVAAEVHGPEGLFHSCPAAGSAGNPQETG